MTPTRRPGLDILRSAAILLVVWDHGLRFLPASVFGGISPYPLLDGVDLFFVLSGWLVGGGLYERLSAGRFTGTGDLFRFYAARWLRTLPAYWTVLALNVLLLALHLTPGLLNGRAVYYAVFLQNFYRPLDLFFWESWSLSVEEWFYLGFPPVLLLSAAVLKKYRGAFPAACLAFIVWGVLFRTGLAGLYPDLPADLYFRKLVLCRLDMIAWGALAYQMSRGGRIGRAPLWAALGIGIWLLAESVPGGWYVRVWKYGLSGFGIACLMPAAAAVEWPGTRLRRFFFWVSRLSYAWYLVHLGLVAGPIRTLCPGAEGWPVWIVYVTVSAAAACVLHFTVEAPFLRLRDRWSARSAERV